MRERLLAGARHDRPQRGDDALEEADRVVVGPVQRQPGEAARRPRRCVPLGEQQRVAIARALALKPTVLLFDEPTSSLDPESTGEVLRVMRELAEDGMTMLLVTHELPFAREVSDWVVFIDRGRVVEQGPPSEVLQRPREDRTRAYVTTYA